MLALTLGMFCFSWHRATETAGFARAAVGLIEGLFCLE